MAVLLVNGCLGPQGRPCSNFQQLSEKSEKRQVQLLGVVL